MDKKIIKSLLYLAAAFIGSTFLLMNIGFFVVQFIAPRAADVPVKKLHQLEADLDYGSISEVTFQGKEQLVAVMKDGSTYTVHTEIGDELKNRVRVAKTIVNYEAAPSDMNEPFSLVSWAIYLVSNIPLIILVAGLVLIARRIQPDRKQPNTSI